MNYSAFFFAILVLAVYHPSSDLSCAAFIFETKQTIRPDLNKIIDAQPDTRITVSLDIGGPEKTASRMAVKGMTLDLVQRPSSEGNVVKMPGRNGPHPELSAGLRQLEFVEDGKFVSMSGVKHVRGTKGAWEVVWKDDAPAGSLLCGFELPESYSRNEATLPEGCIYLSFPVWTKDTLDNMQDEKHRILTKASEFQKEKFRELEKINETNNLFEKIWCYRNALAAAEKYGLQPITRANLVPESNGVTPLNDDFLVTTTGTIWTKKPNGHQVKLGSATLKVTEKSPE